MNRRKQREQREESPFSLFPPVNTIWLVQKTAGQDESGDWVTDYDAAGKKIGVANVETTSLAILGLEKYAVIVTQLP